MGPAEIIINNGLSSEISSLGKSERVPVVAGLRTNCNLSQINKLPEDSEGNFKVIFFAEDT